jgi:hypothetical protein
VLESFKAGKLEKEMLDKLESLTKELSSQYKK